MFLSRSGSSCMRRTCAHKQVHAFILALHFHHHTDAAAFISTDGTGRSKDNGVGGWGGDVFMCVFHSSDSSSGDGSRSQRARGDPLTPSDNQQFSMQQTQRVNCIWATAAPCSSPVGIWWICASAAIPHWLNNVSCNVIVCGSLWRRCRLVRVSLQGPERWPHTVWVIKMLLCMLDWKMFKTGETTSWNKWRFKAHNFNL